MPVSRETFESGLTYEQFKAQMTRNQDRIAAQENAIQLDPADLAALEQLPRPINVLAIVEDWCGDVIANLPILNKLAAGSGKLNVRCVLRDQTDVINSYLNRGQFKSIPVFVFLDQNFNEIGVFTERPDSVTQLRAEKRGEVYKSNPAFGDPTAPVDQLPDDVRAQLNAGLAKMREETAPFANSEVVREIRVILAKAA